MMKDVSVTEEMDFTALAFGGNAVARRTSGKVCPDWNTEVHWS